MQAQEVPLVLREGQAGASAYEGANFTQWFNSADMKKARRMGAP